MGHEDWRRIRDNLSERIARREWSPGDRLPTESQLCKTYGTGRHSVRRAVHALAVEGKLRVVQGSGTFLESAPLINYTIGRRTRFRQNLIAQGFSPGGEHIAADVVPAPPHVARALGLDDGVDVYRLIRLGLADGVPVSLGMSFHPRAMFPSLGIERERGRSITDIYRDHAIPDYFRKRTTLFARLPEPDEAQLLRQHPGRPVMVMSKIDVRPDGVSIGYSEAVWSGDRVQFTFDGLDGAIPQGACDD